MNLQHHAKALLGAAFALCVTFTAPAQTPPPARPGVDARTLLPSAVPDAPPPPRGSGLTREQRKEATIQARQDGSLKPAGEAAEFREPRAVPALAAARPASPPAEPPRPLAAAAPADKAAGASPAQAKLARRRAPRAVAVKATPQIAAASAVTAAPRTSAASPRRIGKAASAP